jgi:hypothetical protein
VVITLYLRGCLYISPPVVWGIRAWAFKDYKLVFCVFSVPGVLTPNQLFNIFSSMIRPTHYRDFAIIPRHNSFSRTPLDEWSARRRDLYLTIHNTQNRQTSMPSRESNPQSKQGSDRRPSPGTARPLGQAINWHKGLKKLLVDLELRHPRCASTN